MDGTTQGDESAAKDAARASHLQSEGKIREPLFSPFNGAHVVPSIAFLHSFPLLAPLRTAPPSGWALKGDPYIGRTIVRRFTGSESAPGRRSVVARIVAHMPEDGEDKALWHAVHEDGDSEDLSEAEVSSGIHLHELRHGQDASRGGSSSSSSSSHAKKSPNKGKSKSGAGGRWGKVLPVGDGGALTPRGSFLSQIDAQEAPPSVTEDELARVSLEGGGDGDDDDDKGLTETSSEEGGDGTGESDARSASEDGDAKGGRGAGRPRKLKGEPAQLRRARGRKGGVRGRGVGRPRGRGRGRGGKRRGAGSGSGAYYGVSKDNELSGSRERQKPGWMASGNFQAARNKKSERRGRGAVINSPFTTAELVSDMKKMMGHRNLRQMDVASELGLSPSNLSQWSNESPQLSDDMRAIVVAHVTAWLGDQEKEYGVKTIVSTRDALRSPTGSDEMEDADGADGGVGGQAAHAEEAMGDPNDITRHAALSHVNQKAAQRLEDWRVTLQKLSDKVGHDDAEEGAGGEKGAGGKKGIKKGGSSSSSSSSSSVQEAVSSVLTGLRGVMDETVKAGARAARSGGDTDEDSDDADVPASDAVDWAAANLPRFRFPSMQRAVLMHARLDQHRTPSKALVSLMDDDEAALAKAGLDGRGAIAVRKALIDPEMVRSVMRRRGLNQQKLAVAIGESTSSLSQWLNRNPKQQNSVRQAVGAQLAKWIQQESVVSLGNVLPGVGLTGSAMDGSDDSDGDGDGDEGGGSGKVGGGSSLARSSTWLAHLADAQKQVRRVTVCR